MSQAAMMDDAVQKALKRRDELRRELEKIENFLEVYEEFSRTEPERPVLLQRQVPVDKSHLIESERDVAKTLQYEGENRRRQRRARPKEIAAACAAILKEAGRPMTRGQLSEALAMRGVLVPGNDQPRYIGTIMWRNADAFENIEGRGYWLKDEPVRDDLIG